MTPSMTSMPPARRKSAIPKKGLSSRQREIHQGTKPATNPGAITRKTADPTIAKTFLIMSPLKQILWPCAMEIGPWQLNSRVRGHPEVILGCRGEFETCPDWVPDLDAGRWFQSTNLKTIRFHGFDHRANWVAKVRNVSSVGSQNKPLFSMRLFTCLMLVLPIAAEPHTVRASRYYNSFDHRNQVLARIKPGEGATVILPVYH